MILTAFQPTKKPRADAEDAKKEALLKEKLSLKRQLDALQSKYDTAQKQNKALEKKYDDIEARHKSLRSQYDQKKQDLKSQTEDSEQLRVQLAWVTEENNQLREKLMITQKRLHDMELMATDLQEQEHAHNSKIVKYEEEQKKVTCAQMTQGGRRELLRLWSTWSQIGHWAAGVTRAVLVHRVVDSNIFVVVPICLWQCDTHHIIISFAWPRQIIYHICQ